jgi:hypothetical protein
MVFHDFSGKSILLRAPGLVVAAQFGCAGAAHRRKS